MNIYESQVVGLTRDLGADTLAEIRQGNWQTHIATLDTELNHMKQQLTMLLMLTIGYANCQELPLAGTYWADSEHYVTIGRDSILAFAMDAYIIPLKEVIGYAIDVELVPYRVIEGETVVFDVRTEQGELQLIGPHLSEGRYSDKSVRAYLRMMVRRWPWNWTFRDAHDPIPRIFVKEIN